MAGLLTRPSVRFDGRHVLVIGVQSVLGGDHLVPVGLQGGHDLAEARAVSPEAVAENNARFDLRSHIAFPFFAGTESINFQLWRLLAVDLERVGDRGR